MQQYRLHNMLYYSHVNEDNRIERTLLEQADYPVVVTVAGSGERVVALMDNESVKLILAVDLNEEALFLLELKIIMLSNSNPENYLKFIGHGIGANSFRKNCFKQIESQLTPACRIYWQQRIRVIEKGILNAGHFEIFLGKIRPLLLFFLGKNFLRLLYSQGFQLSSFQQVKWKISTWLFSQKWVYQLFGNKDTAFTGKGAAIEHIPAALDKLIKNGRAASSFITHLIFKGHLKDMDKRELPPSLQKNVLKRIKERLINKELHIEYHQGDLLDFISRHNNPVDMPVFYSASDILSFEDHAYVGELIKSSLKNTGNIVVVRSFLRNRLSAEQLKKLSKGYGFTEQFDQQESSGMYQVAAIKNQKLQ